MADAKQAKEVFTVLFFCILWYVVSSSNNVIGKMLLNDFPYPMTVTMVQLTSITLYSGPFFNMWGVRKFVDISWSYYVKVIVPLALGKFLASVSSHISIWKVPVSYAHTGKYTLNDRNKTLNRIYYCKSVLIWCERRKCHYWLLLYFQ
jgi:solute carrier family 35 protein E1